MKYGNGDTCIIEEVRERKFSEEDAGDGLGEGAEDARKDMGR